MNTTLAPRMLRPLLALGEGFTQGGLRSLYLGLLGGIIVLFPFGLLFVAGGLLPGRYAWTASVIIALNAGATLVSEMRARPVRSAVIRFLVICVALFGVEYVGVRSGIPFGRYAYSDALGFRVIGVPVAISLAWYATVVNAWRLIRAVAGTRGRGGIALAAVLTGLLTLSLDILLEPMAAFVTRYWIWETVEIPLQNYVGWFLLSVVIAYAYSRGTPESAKAEREMVGGAVVILTTQALLFCVTIMVHGILLPIVCSAALGSGTLIAAKKLARGRGES